MKNSKYKTVENFFTKSNYWRGWVSVDPDRVETRFIKNKLKKEKGKIKLLDIACGNGRLLKFLQKEFKNVDLYGIDVNNNALSIAKQSVPRANLKKASVYKLPYSNKEFDVVVIPSSFMHFERPKEALSEILRVCKNWVFFDLSTKTSISQMLRSVKIMSTSSVPEIRYDLKDIEKLLPKKSFIWEISGALLLTHKLLPGKMFKIYEKLDPIVPKFIQNKFGHSLLVYGKRVS